MSRSVLSWRFSYFMCNAVLGYNKQFAKRPEDGSY